jgi:hypothetical protein
MSHRRTRTIATFIAAGAATLAMTTAASPASAGDLGQHVRECAQTHGFDGEMNPGMHQGYAGWGPSHVCG